MSVQYKSEDGWKNISSSSNNAVDTVADGNMNPVTSNAVYDALPIFEQYIFPLTYIIPADDWIDITTFIEWSSDIVIIPRWLGSGRTSLVDYDKGPNNKVKLRIRNNSPTPTDVTDNCYITVIRSKVNWY